ncbi:MAG: DNA polymerase III subunit beta [Legionellales bacterium]|nr:DNA polymerase III subunit beta [Legionellales bacterium]|tara:strand:- start:50388 stop:51491 length:1104 start_codon:yes stop_codon:yes gene_type:complete
MHITLFREDLLQPLQMVMGVVERRQTLPILSHVLLNVEDGMLQITATDLEVELQARIKLVHPAENSQITVPGRKLVDICRSLPDEAEVSLTLDKQQVTLKSGRSRFTLSTLPAEEFPFVEGEAANAEFNLPQNLLKEHIEHIQFAMAQQDVRYYLNGMLWQVGNGKFTNVATDGHRLALAEHSLDLGLSELCQVIVPRKGIIELGRLLEVSDDHVTVKIGTNHLIIDADSFTFTSKLIDGRFPDYQKVLPKAGNNILICDKEVIKQALVRASVLTNEKYRGVRFELSQNNLHITANNPEQEQAEDELEVNYSGDDLTVGFNVGYLIDVLNAINETQVKFTLSDTNAGVLVEAADNPDYTYVVMPMRL